MTLDPVSIATKGYVCGDGPNDIAIMTKGYVCIVGVVRPPDGSGSSSAGKRHLLSLEKLRQEEDDEVIAILAILAREL